MTGQLVEKSSPTIRQAPRLPAVIEKLALEMALPILVAVMCQQYNFSSIAAGQRAQKFEEELSNCQFLSTRQMITNFSCHYST